MGVRENAPAPALCAADATWADVDATPGLVSLAVSVRPRTAPFVLAGVASFLRDQTAGDPHQAEPGLLSAALFSIERTAAFRGVIDVPKDQRARLRTASHLLRFAAFLAARPEGNDEATRISDGDEAVVRQILTTLYHRARAAVGESLGYDECAEHVDHMDVLRDLEGLNPGWVFDGTASA